MQVEQQESTGVDDITLQCTSGPSEGAIFTRTGNATVLKVGRTRISQIHVKDPAVSEKHAEVFWDGSAWCLRDVGSSNGSWLNGTQVRDGSLRLKDCDIIRFGTDSVFSVKVIKHVSKNLTVEEYLQSECQQMIDHVQGFAERSSNELWDSWSKFKRELQQSVI